MLSIQCTELSHNINIRVINNATDLDALKNNVRTFKVASCSLHKELNSTSHNTQTLTQTHKLPTNENIYTH